MGTQFYIACDKTKELYELGKDNWIDFVNVITAIKTFVSKDVSLIDPISPIVEWCNKRKWDIKIVNDAIGDLGERQNWKQSGSIYKTNKNSRRHMPNERKSITKKFTIHAHPDYGGNIDGYITAGLFEDGTLGEVFITVAKEGTLIRGLLIALGIAVSIGLQQGVPLQTFVDKFKYLKFEPAGLTDDPHPLSMTSSVIDYIFRWLEMKLIDGEDNEQQDSGLTL